MAGGLSMSVRSTRMRMRGPEVKYRRLHPTSYMGLPNPKPHPTSGRRCGRVYTRDIPPGVYPLYRAHVTGGVWFRSICLWQLHIGIRAWRDHTLRFVTLSGSAHKVTLRRKRRKRRPASNSKYAWTTSLVGGTWSCVLGLIIRLTDVWQCVGRCVQLL